MMNGLRLNSEAVPMFPATVLGATNDNDYRIKKMKYGSWEKTRI